ncbi:MAG: alpha/beta hydrolase family protein [Myxococcota bacterium]
MTKRLILAVLLAAAICVPIMATAETVGFHADKLFANDDISIMRVSPDGQWLIAAGYSGKKAGLLAQRLGVPGVKPVHSTRFPATSVNWIGRNTVLAEFGTGLSRYFIRLDLSEAENEEGFEYKKTRFHAPGSLVAPLPLSDDVVIWEIDLKNRNTVHRVEIDELQDSKSKILGKHQRGPATLGVEVASISGTSHRWLVNQEGTPLIAARYDEDGYTLLHRADADSEFKKFYQYKFGESKRLWPHGWGDDETTIVVSGHNGETTIGLFEYDLESRSIKRKIIQRDDVDIEWVMIDPVTGDVLGAQYDLGSARKIQHLESSRERFGPRLGAQDPPIEAITVTSSSTTRERFVYWTENPTEPGAFYYRDTATEATSLVGRTGSKIDRSALRPLESFVVDSTDGFSIEALLTLPAGSPAQGHPLVVMPHGGPVGVHDRQSYDPIVQYLASWGFAVLQANYRGSTGYGLEFMEAGKRQWARGIEDDIAAAVASAAARSTIDADRICIIGGSYGGFSAITSVLRQPETYRCAGTINGVSDVPLMFESSDFADSKAALKLFTEVVGNPETELDRLLEISPVYQLEKIEVPVLVVYGDADRRVDRDHAHRLLALLRLYGKEYEEVRVKNGQHSFARSEWISVLPAIRRFLTAQLMPNTIFLNDSFGK